MTAVQDITKAISQLSAKDLTQFREWFEEFDAMAWDEQLEKDVKLGKLDRLAKEALRDYEAGKCKEI